MANSSIHTGLIGLALASSLALLRAPAFGQATAPSAPQTFAVAGNVHAPFRLNAAQLSARFAGMMKPVHYTLKGVDHVADAVPLIALVVAAQPKFDPHVKHDMLQYMVTVTGQDGYKVVFSLGEMMPDFGNEPIWVAADEDGKPLDADDGPVELVIPGDVKPARWVHGVGSIDIEKIPSPGG